MSTALRSIGKYELRKRLASSHLNELWLAQESRSQHYVLIKVFYTNHQADSNAMKQLFDQAEAIASLQHSNLVHLYDVFVFPSRDPNSSIASMVCLVTDYVEGQTLVDYLHSTSNTAKMRPGADIVALFTPISLAVDYAHQHGVIHGNLKPSNILLSSMAAQGRISEPLITDFGFTKLLRHANGKTSPFYLSPEQIRGKPANDQSDIYALGVILYELFTGVLPFRGNRPVAIMVQHLNTPPTPPAFMNPTISSAVANVMLRCLAKEPEARFSSAASMTVALAIALNTPVPVSLSQSISLLDSMDWPDSSSSLPFTSQPGASQSSMLTTSGNTGSASPAMRTNNKAGSSSLSTAVLKKRKRGLLTPHYLLIICVLLLASLGTLGLLSLLQQRSTLVAPYQSVGHAYFMSSGQFNADSPQGINDEVQINLINMPDPPIGKSYYAWLLADKDVNESLPVLLGPLNVDHGKVNFLYRGNQQHTNLLGVSSRFLIIVDDAHNPTNNPLLDTSIWRYYAEIPAVPSPVDKLHFSMLVHLRHLLVESPELNVRGLHGGLGFWFVRNTSTVSELANSSRDAWHNKDVAKTRDQVIRILDYVDGASFAHTDTPPGTPLLTDVRTAKVALLGPAPTNPDPPGYAYSDDVPPGYVYLISEHMAGAIQSPLTTPDQRKLAVQINTRLDNEKRMFEQIQQDAKRLLQMSYTQMLGTQALTILNDLATQAQNAYNGQLDPTTGQSDGGSLWIYGNLQRLASFDIRQYPAQ
ncbi:MAG TPA: serine/threonine-protein kinase [Ktedonobacteraceae bacterium]